MSRSRAGGVAGTSTMTVATLRHGDHHLAAATLSAGRGQTEESFQEAFELDPFSRRNSPPAFSSRILSLFGDCQIKNKRKAIDRLVVENNDLRQRVLLPGQPEDDTFGGADFVELPGALD